MPVKPTLKLSFAFIKDMVYIGSILVGIILYFVNEGKKDAVIETKIEQMLENQNSILEKFKENDVKWENQSKYNGRIDMYIMLNQ